MNKYRVEIETEKGQIYFVYVMASDIGQAFNSTMTTDTIVSITRVKPE